ncbi:SDR family NAD(P)-dependent oxidoreductase [Bauldia sp.]|uniref:SDR family NAD(P)-dependent oxidoreductase n=1 Tax=Bauldia sp. TaxID=2575872 RepID=UPI003BADAF87
MADWIGRFSLEGRKALVTGASKGLGAEICDVFADAGADVVATARDEAGLKAAYDAVTGHGRRCVTLPCDLADADSVRSMGQAALDAFGGIDILVNNAGATKVAPAGDLTGDDWDFLMAVNARAPFLLSQIVAPGMIERHSGKIINVSSQTGVVALDDHAAYASSKGALNSLTKSLAIEWAKHNIQVNAICPTVVLTTMGTKVWGDEAKAKPMLDRIPAGRFGEPIEIADLALFLASSASSFINGELVMIEGGYTSL